jgi:cysteinyl-tRNA synthetase
VDEYDKDAVHDFALWKRSTDEELERGIYYDTPWGAGRPGWHIECSVMSRELMGDTIDIHIGGEDLVFPHHENEVAQSETLTGKRFVRYWVHVRHLMINGGKMSKSLGNIVGFDDILSRYSQDAFRYFYLTTHYRRPLDYTDANMEGAKNSSERLENSLDLVEHAMRETRGRFDFGAAEERLLERVGKMVRSFGAAMDDDLNTHGALDALHAISGALNEYLAGIPNKGVLREAYEHYRRLLDVLGLFEDRCKEIKGLDEKVLKLLIDVREKLRDERMFELSDRIRMALDEIGVSLMDTPEGTKWKIEGSDS